MITIIYREQEQDLGYHYIIQQNCQDFSAYKTEKGFNDFIKRHEIDLTISEQYNDEKGKQVIIYRSERTIKDSYFIDISQLPSNTKKYIDLCNGLVDCYYTKDCIFRPNPNYKDIYIPLDLKDHIAFQSING